MIAKKHIVDGKIILAMCDSNILGKKFEEGEKMLDLSGSFYKGDETTGEELIEMIHECYLVNGVGPETIKFLKCNSFIDDTNILLVNGVPYVQVIVKN